MARTRNPYGNITGGYLGSGARTTTGGSYVNPRLGISDYTGFQRGFGASFRLPKQQKKEKITIDGVTLATENTSNNDFMTVDGVEVSIGDKESKIFMNNFQTGEMQNLYNIASDSKSTDFEKAQALGKVRIYNSVFGEKDSNLAYLNNKISNPEDVDYRATNINGEVKIPGLDGDSSYSIPMMYKGFADGTLTPASRKIEGTNIEYHGVVDTKTGEFLNLEAMDKNWVDTNVKSFYNVSDNILVGYDSVKNMSFDPIEFTEKTFQDDSGKTFQVTDERSYFEAKDINNFEQSSFNFVSNEYRDIKATGELDSAIGQVFDAVNNGSFKLPTNADNDRFGVIAARQAISEADPKDPNYKVLQQNYIGAVVKDYLNENFKRQNGSDYYGFDNKKDSETRGRAIPRIKKNASFFETARVEQKPDSDGDSGGGGISKPDRSRIDRFFRLFNKGLEVQTFGENVSVEGKPGLVINESAIENFFQEYDLPIAGSNRKVGGIEYLPDRYGKGGMPGDAGLGALKVKWVKSGDDDRADEEITYDLNDEGSVLKLVSKMKAIGKSPELTPAVVTGIVNEFQRLKDVVKGGALRDPSEIPPTQPQ
jgi:hypothetical protein